MSKLRRSSKLMAVLVIVSVFFTACEVPDISKFTEQSSEMTRGIRKGVKDTEGLLKAATERRDLYSAATITKFQGHLKDYRKAMKPTVAALDGLDGYLEALNALSQANKKSGENARTAVTSVANLVNVVSGFEIAGTTLNVATGLVALAEQFRTAKDFKNRVTIAAEIVEGVRPAKDENGKTIFVRNCTGDANDKIIAASKGIQGLAQVALERTPPTDKQRQELSGLSGAEKWEYLYSEGILNKGEMESISTKIAVINGYHCGVIDFIKFNVQDLKGINSAVSQLMFDNARAKNQVVLDLHQSIVNNDRVVQNELERILSFKALVPAINQFVNDGADEDALNSKLTLKNNLEDLFNLDPEIKTAVIKKIEDCGDACGEMLRVLKTPTSRNCDSACFTALQATLRSMTRAQYDLSVSHILPILDDRSQRLSEQNQQYLAELDRIKPSYEAATTELQAIKSKGNQLDALLDSSLTALDAWAETHANLRVAVNTKKPLTAAKLASKVREIWTIINPEAD